MFNIVVRQMYITALEPNWLFEIVKVLEKYNYYDHKKDTGLFQLLASVFFEWLIAWKGLLTPIILLTMRTPSPAIYNFTQDPSVDCLSSILLN